MKKIVLLLAIGLTCVSGLYAQPILTAATSNPVVGDRYYGNAVIVAAMTAITPATISSLSGADVTWDFSGLVTAIYDPSTYAYVSCASAPYCDSFPGSNMALVINGEAHEYLTTGSNGCAVTGSYSSGVGASYFTNNQTVLYYPLTYNSTQIDTATIVSLSMGGIQLP